MSKFQIQGRWVARVLALERGHFCLRLWGGMNPDAHFGLEKYHLALLQYLIRDAKYQSRHVYVDEFTAHFLTARGGPFFFTKSSEAVHKSLAEFYTNNLAEAEADYDALSRTNLEDYRLVQMLGTLAALDVPPAYRENGILDRIPSSRRFTWRH